MTIEEVIDELRKLGERCGFDMHVWCNSDGMRKGSVNAVFLDDGVTETGEWVAFIDYQPGLNGDT